MEETPMTDVVYIGGAGRSGSTVLALLLGRLPEFVAVGGLTNLWERGLQQNYLCGCGVAFRSCPFWNQVGLGAFGGWNEVNLDEVLRLKHAVVRYRHWPVHLMRRTRPTFAAAATKYSDYMRRLYTAAARVSGTTAIVDNSHDVSPALLLMRTPGIRVHVVHLVRDSRGVTFSLSKHVARLEASGAIYMPRYSSVGASTQWMNANLPYHLIPSSALPCLRVRYESLVNSPAKEISRILEFLGRLPAASEIEVNAGPIEIAENHMISGNPHRLGRQQIELRLDDEWRRAMKPADRILTTLLTLPLGVAYGYIGIRSSRTRRHTSA
jgi:hypothetical protein